MDRLRSYCASKSQLALDRKNIDVSPTAKVVIRIAMEVKVIILLVRGFIIGSVLKGKESVNSHK